MRSLVRAFRILRFKRRNRIAREAKPYNLSQIEVCPCDKFTGEPQHYYPEKGWRLLARIGYTGTTAKIDQTRDTELNEELLERIDFLACLFAARRTNK